MKDTLRRNIYFYTCCFIYWIAAGIYLLTNDKGGFSLWLNDRHTPGGDLFFRYITWMGDGVTISLICLFLFFVKFRIAVIASVVSVFSSVMITAIKNIVHAPRPVEYFDMKLNYVNGVSLFHWNSFPSGHTAAAFALFCVLGFFVKTKTGQLLFFLIAITVALSRVYLLQHFLIDVYFGSIFGVINATLIYVLLSNASFMKGKKWTEKSLLKLKRQSE